MYSRFFVWLYGKNGAFFRNVIRRIVYKLEKGECFSPTLREIFKRYHDVEIGMYSYGGCFVPNAFGRKTTVGRYCSIAATAFTATRNHPTNFKSSHAFFYNPALKQVKDDKGYSPLAIGNDVWLGHNSIIVPSVNSIGDGAVIGAGAVVVKDIPPYAIVVGNPGRIVRYRFSEEKIRRLLEEKWWEKPIEELKKKFDDFTTPYEE